jgi:hypothetical protein
MSRKLLPSRSKARSLEASWAAWEDATVTLEDLGNVGEFVGALAVVASLIYLAVQLRQNTKQMVENGEEARLAALERAVQASSQLRLAMIRDAGVADIWIRGSRNLTDLDEQDALRFYMLVSDVLFNHETYFMRCQLTDPERWPPWRNTLRRLLVYPGFQELLKTIKPDLKPAFAAEMERIAVESADLPAPLPPESPDNESLYK